MSIGAFIWLACTIIFFARLVREVTRPGAARSTKKIFTEALFMAMCAYMFFGRLGVVPRI